MAPHRASREAFSLVELLVLIGLVGIMLGLLLPAVQAARESSARAGCLSNLKQIGLALHLYHGSNGCFPPSRPVDPTFPTQDPDTLLSWMALLLPYIEQGPLWDAAKT